jgi:hypothetical protein
MVALRLTQAVMQFISRDRRKESSTIGAQITNPSLRAFHLTWLEVCKAILFGS